MSISYLGRQTSRAISRRKRRANELKGTLAKITSKLEDVGEIDAIQKEIEYYKKQQKSLERNLFWLSLKGAVIAPTAVFSTSLIMCIFGILEVFRSDIFLGSSAIFVFIGSLCLGKALAATERAALEVPQPKYDIFFRETEHMTTYCKAKTSKSIEITFHNIGEELSENTLLVVYFPIGILVLKAGGRWRKAPLLSEESKKFVSLFSADIDCLNIDGYFHSAPIEIRPEQTGTYKIPVIIKDRSGKSEHELTLIVR